MQEFRRTVNINNYKKYSEQKKTVDQNQQSLLLLIK